MKISSPAFNENDQIPAKYSRQGGDISPPLIFSDVPSEAKSLALVCHDPDAPGDKGWTHWIVWNISPETNGLTEGSVPTGATQGVTDWGENHWGGPQPLSGTHHYIFYLYALDSILDLSTSTMRADLERYMNGHLIEAASLTGLFSAA